MSLPTIAVAFGTRPEAIKMAPVVKALQSEPRLRTRVWVTGQHRQMLDQILDTAELERLVAENWAAKAERFAELLVASKNASARQPRSGGE